MKFATFIDPATIAGPRFGIVRESGMVDAQHAAQRLGMALPANSVKAALCTGRRTLDALEELAQAAESRGLVQPVETLRYLPPIPDPSKFLCVGKNSREHRQELIANGMMPEMPQEPTGFIKLIDTMVGQDAEVARPEGITTFDYEPELAFVIGRDAHQVPKGKALDYVAGFTLFNDLTAREIQKREVISGTKFWTAKNMPGFAPIGPFVITLDEVRDPFDLWVTCTVNGGMRMRENTSQYIFRIDDVIEHFSRYVAFQAGDLIAMGAPKGVAMGQPNAAELYLRPGDQMEIAFEGLMSLRTKIVAPAPARS